MGTKLENLIAEVRDAGAKAQAIIDTAEAAGRDLTGDEMAAVKAHVEAGVAKRKELDKLKADDDVIAQVKALGDLGLTDDAGSTDPVVKAAVDAGLIVPGHKGKTIGSQFLESAQFKALAGRWPGGHIPERASVNSEPVGVKGLGSKALITGGSATSAGALVDPDMLGLRDAGGVFMRPLTIRDLVTTGTTESDSVTYARVTGFTNAAAPVAESTTTADPGAMTAANGVKPESAMTLVEVTDVVKTIAHWVPATKRALSDAGQMRMLIDQFLLYGLDEELEDQIMTGDGTGQNFTGLLTLSGTTQQAWDTDLLVTLRRAITKVGTVGRARATGFVLNPADVETLDLLRDANGQFYGGGPFAPQQASVWRLPIVESESIPAGTGLVGDFRQAFLLDREQSAITVSDSHANFFIRNMVAILAELRAVFGCFRPAAFVEIDTAA
jgi:HK97 family phage major capsid protein